MNLALLKGVLALAATSALLVGSAILYRRRGTMGSVLQLLAVTCFVIVAFTHVLEPLQIFPGMGWGQPRSIGHYIDVCAAILGLTLMFAGLLPQHVQRTSRVNSRPNERGLH
jgi:succinate dehydrogenase/fumarate reductase cytochrome b subunit